MISCGMTLRLSFGAIESFSKGELGDRLIGRKVM